MHADLNSEQPSVDTLKVIKRDGSINAYDENKIHVAISKAYLAIEGEHATASERIHEIATLLTQAITKTFQRRMPNSQTIHIEDIQDQVELMLMREGEHKVARAYVLYREERTKAREAEAKAKAKKQHTDTHDKPALHVTLTDGTRAPLDQKHIETIVQEACEGLANVNGDKILTEAFRNLYDGVPIQDVNAALVMSTRQLIEQEPRYSEVAARLLLDGLRTEALSFLGMPSSATQNDMARLYPEYFQNYISRAVELERLDPRLMEFDFAQIGQAMAPERDQTFTYLGLQTLYDRYFIHHENTRFELPQAFFMRVSMGLALEEDAPTDRAIEFYHQLSKFDYMSSTPTLFNSGTLRSQLSSCFLTTVSDDLNGIYGAIKDNALLSKWAGGLGNDWTPVRAMGAHIKGTNGKSQGVVPFLKVVNDTAVAVNQGGKRKGAVCAYLETWHMDIEEFIELRKNTGDDRRRTHDMNTANWIPDLFMKRVSNDEEWTLFSPDEAPELHDTYGDTFEQHYAAYEEKARAGEIRSKTIQAKELWRKILGMVFETGHPWITFKDACNLRSPQQHTGIIHSSNLCTEITLNTSADEVAVCNLGSINLPAHTNASGLDLEKLKKTVTTAIRMLDNVVDINYYAIEQARNSNLKHRPIGLGIMGFQDALYKLSIPYGSEEAITFADRSMEAISYFAIEASCELAREKGTYQSYAGSLWSQGILPIDSIELLAKSRGEYLDQNTETTMDWTTLRDKVKAHGMRNSNVLAIAPTATISNICGVSQSIEPTYQNLFVKSNLSGEFTVINPYLVEDLKALNLWDAVMVNDLKYYDGSVQAIERIPQHLKLRYATAFEVEPKWLIEAASRRQKWIDQAQSLNLYIASPSGKKLDIMYRMAWLKGLKTTYYLRSLGATDTEKATIDRSKLNAVTQEEPLPKVCSILDPECESCQ